MNGFAEGDNVGCGHVQAEECRKLRIGDSLRRGLELGNAGKPAEDGRAQKASTRRATCGVHRCKSAQN
jgi:hypothetical protein